MIPSPAKRLFVLCSVVFATTLLPAPSRAAPAPAPTFESVASLVTAIPTASAVAVLRLMRPEGFKPREEVENFEVQPWGAAADTRLAILSVNLCYPVEPIPPNTAGYVPSLWLAIVQLPPPPARPALLARPIGGFMQAEDDSTHHYTLGQGPISIGPGKQAFVVNHSFSIPFGGGGAQVTVDHIFWVRQGDLALVFSAVSKYDAMYGGDWHEDGTRDHPEENVNLSWEITKKATDGFFNLCLRDADAGPKARRALYTWRGEAYATGAKGFFSNEQRCLEDSTLTLPSETWQKHWLQGELNRLLAAGDIEGVMGLDVGFEGKVRQGDGLLDKPSRAQILTLAHQSALARYQTSSALALRLLGYGICQATAAQGIEAQAFETDPPLFERLLQVDDPKAVAALNDHAFILGKNRRHATKAVSLLRSVLTLDPKRRVAYLNLADLLWSKGKKEEARTQYRRYLDLSAVGATDIPSRAQERAAPASASARYSTDDGSNRP